MGFPAGKYKGKWKRPDLSEYNRIHKAGKSPMSGKKHTVESIAKMSKSKTGCRGTRNGAKHSAESKAKMSASHKGWKNPNPRRGPLSPTWKGGKTKEGRSIRLSTRYVNFRKSVLLFDCYTCVRCGDDVGPKQVHHIKSFAKYPELRYDISNAETLCIPCHEKEHPGIFLKAKAGG